MRVGSFSQKGLSLVELMISMAIGLVAASALITLYASTVSYTSHNLSSTQLNQDLKYAMDFMLKDIRRAGYWGDATTSIGQQNLVPNPFTSDANNLTLHNDGSCITYSYDHNISGDVDEDEYLGFRFVEGGSLEAKVSGTTSADCDDGEWEIMSDDRLIMIDLLAFSDAASRCTNITDSPTTDCYDENQVPSVGDNTIEVRAISITLAGSLKRDQETTLVLNETVRVRNDRVKQH